MFKNIIYSDFISELCNIMMCIPYLNKQSSEKHSDFDMTNGTE